MYTNQSQPIISINYLADPVVWSNLVSIVRNIREEMGRLQEQHRLNTGISDNLVGAWDEFIRDLLRLTVTTAQNWARTWVRNARNEYEGDNREDVVNFLARLSTLLRHALDLELSYDDLPSDGDGSTKVQNGKRMNVPLVY
jgi:hypothetical protein